MKREAERIPNMCGGKGSVLLERLLDESVMKDQCGLFAKVVIKPFCSLGYHEHHGEREIYYILAGKGVYDDNGQKRTVSAGEVLVCADGCGHALENTDLGNLEFMALILKE